MDIDAVKGRTLQAISPLKAADSATLASKEFLFSAKRTNAGRKLPAYYLVYFLLVDLLGFRNLGRFEKVAWTVPVDYKGRLFTIEHRKFGLGVFAANLPADEADAAEIVMLIHKAAKVAQSYFDWRAAQAAKESRLNVVNRSRDLFERLEFYLNLYDARRREAEDRKDERIKTDYPNGGFSVHYPAHELLTEAKWFALSAIECFFAWTEHTLIHIAILNGKCSTGEQVAGLAEAEWATKFKAALDLADGETKDFYDKLIILRRQLRNFVAHGAFGKDGEAFQFHSNAGAVPMLLPHAQQNNAFAFGQGLDIKPEPAIELVRSFIKHLWSGSRAPAKIYVQDFQHPLILTHVADGAYADAMVSEQAMSEFALYMAHVADQHANMDF